MRRRWAYPALGALMALGLVVAAASAASAFTAAADDVPSAGPSPHRQVDGDHDTHTGVEGRKAGHGDADGDVVHRGWPEHVEAQHAEHSDAAHGEHHAPGDAD